MATFTPKVYVDLAPGATPGPGATPITADYLNALGQAVGGLTDPTTGVFAALAAESATARGAEFAAAADSQPTLPVVAAVTANAVLAVNTISPADATAGPFTVTLPAPTAVNQQIVVEKTDAGPNVVTVAGTIRGTATTVNLALTRETVVFVAESLTSWRPVSGHKTLSSLDKRYVAYVNFTDPRYADPGGDAGMTWNNCVAALGANGGTIYVPAGVYTGTTVPTLANSIVCIGAGESASILRFNGGGFTWSTAVRKVRFEHINLGSAGGDLFAPTVTGGLYQSSFTHCVLQNIDGHCLYNQQNSAPFQEVSVVDCELNSGASGTVPAWNVVQGNGGGNSNRFLRLRVNGANNPNRPFFWLESSNTTTYIYDNVFADITGEQNVGGLIWLLSNYSSEIRNCVDWDAGVPYTGDIIRIAKSATNPIQSKWCLVAGSGRRAGTLGAGVYDINIGTGNNSAIQCIAMRNTYSSGTLSTLYTAGTLILGETVAGGLTAPNGVTLGAGLQIRSGTGDPNGVVLGSVGDEWRRTNGTANTTEYVKTSGTATTTGWVAKPLATAAPPIGRLTGSRILLAGLPRAMGLANMTMAKDTWLFMPCSTSEAIALSYFAMVLVTVASGGTAALTFGLYAVDSYNRPGALVTDFTSLGTADLTTGGASVEKTFALTGGVTIPAGDWYIGAAWTGTATVAPVLTGVGGTHPQVLSIPASSAARTAYAQAVTGAAAPAPAAPATLAAPGLAVWGVRA